MKSTRGFTLIEVLVAISVMGILVSVATANFRDFTVRQQVDSLTRTIGADLHSAQGRAASGEKPAGCTGGLSGYQVTFNGNAGAPCGAGTRATSYTIAALCPGPTSAKTVNLSSTQFVCINRVPASASFIFKPLQSGTNISDTNSFIITSESTQSTNTITTTITSTGQIQ